MKTRHSNRRLRAGSPALVLLTLYAMARSAEAPPTLKSVFNDQFLVGTALNERQFTERDTNAAGFVRLQFNSVAPENALKWASLHPRPGTAGFNFEMADRYVEFGEKNGMFIVGHCLVWHRQTPTWVFAGTNPPPTNSIASFVFVANTNAPATNEPARGRFGGRFRAGFSGRYNGPRASREELLQRMREHIHTVVGRYKGRIKSWDVVNEAIADGPGTNILRNSLWLEIIGPDFIAKAFEYAHEADPDAILRYNDYGLESSTKRRKLLALIRSLQEQKVPIHAIGSQAHLNVSINFETMDQELEDLEKLGLPVHITELDVNVAADGQRGTQADVAANASATQGGLVSDASRKQAEAYAGIFRAFLKHAKSIKLVTFWGATDRDSWRRNGTPLLFDLNGNPKPAFDAVIAEGKKSK